MGPTLDFYVLVGGEKNSGEQNFSSYCVVCSICSALTELSEERVSCCGLCIIPDLCLPGKHGYLVQVHAAG